MRRLTVLSLGFFALLFVDTVNAETLTGCITPGGTLKNIAQGEEPLMPCGPNESLVQWESANSSTGATCPCDILKTATWAGWLGPVCHVNDQSGVEVAFHEDEGMDQYPRISIKVRDNNPVDYPECFVQNDDGIFQLVDNTMIDFTEEMVEACLRDINEVALMLGFGDGCKLD